MKICRDCNLKFDDENYQCCPYCGERLNEFTDMDKRFEDRLNNIPATETMITVLKNNPRLHYLGVEVYGDSNDEERMSPFLSKEDDFMRTYKWIMTKFLYKVQNINPQSSSSYGLKHLMERDIGLYVTNGMFICAMIAAEFKMKIVDGNPNVRFNISMKNVNTLEKRLRGDF